MAPCHFLVEKIWIINESVSYCNDLKSLDCFVATCLATTPSKIVPYRDFLWHDINLHPPCRAPYPRGRRKIMLNSYKDFRKLRHTDQKRIIKFLKEKIAT